MGQHCAHTVSIETVNKMLFLLKTKRVVLCPSQQGIIEREQFLSEMQDDEEESEV